jgi:hypothetical protein
MNIALLVLLLIGASESMKAPVNDGGAELAQVRRIYVDKLNGGETAAQIRDLMISALQATCLFVVTENEERADVFLRGSAEDLIYTNKFSSSEGVNTNRNGGSGRSGSGITAKGGRYFGGGASENESTHIEERKHEAIAAVRLVNKAGDVIWSTTQESTGAKFRGASADVADKVTKQLAADLERARKATRLP